MISPESYVNIHKACLQKLNQPDWTEKKIGVSVLRLDKIHPVVSGNKWFKLKYYIQHLPVNCEGIISVGGAFSNHLHAVAHICAQHHLRSVGVIRGEKPPHLSPTLQDCQRAGMELLFVSRTAFKNKNILYTSLREQFNQFLLVPEGSAGEPGIKGAREILDLVTNKNFSHLVCAAGTGTMSAGLLGGLQAHQQLVVIPAIKIARPGENSIDCLLRKTAPSSNWSIFYDYHFGGYAKYTSSLIEFINLFYVLHQIPLDIVYTSKMAFAVDDLIRKNHFHEGDHIIMVHSGGLQGNRSLPWGYLHFPDLLK